MYTKYTALCAQSTLHDVHIEMFSFNFTADSVRGGVCQDRTSISPQCNQYSTLHSTALLCTALHCTALHCTTPKHATLHSTTVNHIALNYTTLHQTALQCTTLHYSKSHCTTLHKTALHCKSLDFKVCVAPWPLLPRTLNSVETQPLQGRLR